MTRPREIKIENYLRERVVDTGGQVRKQVWPGHRGSPDDFCWWPARTRDLISLKRRHAWVECKRPGGVPDPHQAREIAKMRLGGLPVWTISTKEEVDEFIEEMTCD